MHPGMRALTEVNDHINDLRDVRVSQVVRAGEDVDIAFDASPHPFTLRLAGVIALIDRGVCNAPLFSGIAFVPVTRYGRSAAAKAGIDPEHCIEIWLDDVVASDRVVHRLAAVALRVGVVGDDATLAPASA